MSWDVFIMKFPKEFRKVSDIPGNFEPESLGSRDEVIKAIRSVAPTAALDSDGWLAIERADYSITTFLGTNEVCSSLMLEVRGRNENAAYVIQEILKRLNARGIETGEGQFLESDGDPTTGFKAWSHYLDYVLNKTAAERQTNWLRSLPFATALAVGFVIWLIYRRMDKARPKKHPTTEG